MLLFRLGKLFFTSSCLFLTACVSTGNTITNNHYQLCKSEKHCEQQRVLRLCEATNKRYQLTRDRLMYDEYGDLFTKDAVFQIQGGPVAQGKQQIVQALRERGPKSTTRHLSQLIDLQLNDDGSAKGLAYVTVWLVDNESDPKDIKQASGPWAVAEYHDEYLIKKNHCLINNRLVKIIFRNAS